MEDLEEEKQRQLREFQENYADKQAEADRERAEADRAKAIIEAAAAQADKDIERRRAEKAEEPAPPTD